jgi:hypothetical protein
MQTHDTTEIGLRATVGTLGMPTRAAALAGVGRIANDQRHSSALRLVGHKRSQLPKRPIAAPQGYPVRVALAREPYSANEYA